MAGSRKQPAPITDFRQYDSSPNRRVHYYAELAVSSPAVAETIASTHCNYTHGEMARLFGPEWPGWTVDPSKVVINPSTNQARRSLT